MGHLPTQKKPKTPQPTPKLRFRSYTDNDMGDTGGVKDGIRRPHARQKGKKLSSGHD